MIDASDNRGYVTYQASDDVNVIRLRRRDGIGSLRVSAHLHLSLARTRDLIPDPHRLLASYR